MTFRAKFFALAFAGACGVAAPSYAETVAAKPVAAASAAALDAYFSGVESAALSASLASEADYRAFASALADRASLTFGSFTDEAGGAVARDVTVTVGDKKDAGLKIGELRLWKGGKAAKGDVTAERLDARRISSFGLETLIEETTNAYTKAIVDGVEGASGREIEAGAKAELQAASDIEVYTVAVDRLVIDGMVLHAADKKPAATLDEFGAMMRLSAAMGRALSARAMIARGMAMDMSSSAAGTTSRMTFEIPFYGQRGVARGDVDASVMTGLSFSIDGTSEAKEGAPAIPVAMAGGVGRYAITGLRLSKLLDYWSRGESPPPKETGLLSLGVWESENERYTLGGTPFYSLDYARTDLSKFRWFLPTSITATARNFTYDIGGLMRFAQSAAPQTGEGAQDLSAMIALLDKHGFSKFTFSGDTAYDWSPETGATRLVTKNDVATLGRLDLNAGAGFPTFKDFAALHPKKGEAYDPAKMTALFADASLADATITVADKGVLARGFALMADLQAAQAGAPAGSVKGPDLRAAAAFSMRSLGAAPSPLAPIYAAVADFIADGGVLSLSASPASPIPLSAIMVPGPNGEDPITRLNLSATRKAE